MWYPKEGGFKLKGYFDSDFIGCKIDRKNISGTCQFLGNRLVSWFSKKQTSITISIVETEYIVVGSCCAQILWMQQQLNDYSEDINETSIYCDNPSAITITQNPVLYSKTKHIDI